MAREPLVASIAEAVGPDAQDAAADAAGAEPSDGATASSREQPHTLLWRLSKKLGTRYVERLTQGSSRAIRSLDRVPKRMHLVANQTQLVLELIDDFATGVYREVPWPTVAILAGAVLYSVSPADVIPDAIPIIGAMDDLVVVAIATRVARDALKKYCVFKGYNVSDYFTGVAGA